MQKAEYTRKKTVCKCFPSVTCCRCGKDLSDRKETKQNTKPANHHIVNKHRYCLACCGSI